jgi:hypothetical protein
LKGTFGMKNRKSLEETIKELRNKYKNVPSPLSENYNKMNQNVNFTPQQKTADSFRQELLTNFKLPKRGFQ